VLNAGDDEARTRGGVTDAMANANSLGMVLGVPLVICLLAMLVGHLYRDRDAEVLDWQPARSAEREAELAVSELDQLRASLETLRRRRSNLGRGSG
jgi:hypothetical protein